MVSLVCYITANIVLLIFLHGITYLCIYVFIYRLIDSLIHSFSDGVEGEFREQHVRLTFREAVQLFEHRSQFIRRSSNACLVTTHLHYLLIAGTGWAENRLYFSVRNPQRSKNIFFHVTTVAVSIMILHSLEMCFRGSILYFSCADC